MQKFMRYGVCGLVLGLLTIGCQGPISTDTLRREPTSASDQGLFQVEVLFIRHAQSCGNIAGFSVGLTPAGIDPALTDCGVFRSLQAGVDFRSYLASRGITLDLRGASNLRRTKETMLLMAYNDFFKAHERLYEIPYIGEIEHTFGDLAPSISYENMPENSLTQTLKISASFPFLADYPQTIDSSYSAGIDRGHVKYSRFRQDVLPAIARDLRRKEQKNTYHLAIATHSLFMRSHLRCTRPGGDPGILSPGVKPNNNEVYSVVYQFKTVEGQPVLLDPVEIPACTYVVLQERPEHTKKVPDAARCEYFNPGNDVNFPFGLRGYETPEAAIEWLSPQVSPSCRL